MIILASDGLAGGAYLQKSILFILVPCLAQSVLLTGKWHGPFILCKQIHGGGGRGGGGPTLHWWAPTTPPPLYRENGFFFLYGELSKRCLEGGNRKEITVLKETFFPKDYFLK